MFRSSGRRWTLRSRKRSGSGPRAVRRTNPKDAAEMRAKRFFQAVSSGVLVTFVSLTMQPLQAAIQVQRAQAKAATPAPKAADEKYGETLREIEEQSLEAKGNRGKGK